MVTTWKTVKLDSVAKTMSGGTPSRTIEAYYSGNIPWVTTSELNDGYIYKTKEYITNKAIETSSAKLFPAGTVLMAMYGATIGKLGILAMDATTNQACCAFFPQEKVLDSKYLYYVLLHNRKNFISLGIGAGQPNISQHIIQNTELLLPEIDEQAAIATALSDTDALIESLEKLIAKKQAVKQGAMQELLTGKRRLKGFSGEWETVRLLDIIELFNGLTYTPNNIKETGTLVLRSANIQNGKIVFNDNVFVDIVVDEVKTVHKNDIVICVRNGSAELLGKCAMAENNYPQITFGAFMAVLRGKMAPFVYQLLSMGNIQKDILRNSNSTINQITNSDFASIYISVPTDKEEQQAIAQILTDMDDEISALQKKLDKVRRIKQGMMAELLTGRIRLN